MLPDAIAAGLGGGERHEVQFLGDVAAGDAIFGEAAIRLEVEKAGESVRTEDPIDFPRVETESVETSLEFGNIVTAHHRYPPV